MWVLLGFLVTFIIVLLRSGTGYPSSSFPTESFFFFWGALQVPFAPLVLCNYVFDGLVDGFDWMISLCFTFSVVTDLV
jgi:hypothetical protein